MRHFQISLLILNLIAGFGIVLFIFTIYKKSGQRFLKSLLYYALSFNLVVFVDLNYKYTLSNIFNDQFSAIPASVTIALLLLIFIAEFGITYFLYSVVCGLKKQNVSKRANYLFGTWFVFFAFASVIGIYRYFNFSGDSWFYVIHEVWIFSMLLIILATLTDLLIFSRRSAQSKERSVLNAFSFIFFVGYTSFTISQLDFYFFHISIEDYDPLILLIVNICPVLWLHFYYPKIQPAPLSSLEKHVLSKKFIKEFSITKREQEIIELLVAGKTNNEIENTLFISFNTVKNHIYNIFKKTEVNSRIQLLNRIRQYSTISGEASDES